LAGTASISRVNIVFTYIPPWAMANLEGKEEEEAEEAAQELADASFTDMGLYEAHAGDYG
jgi:hypothetical protein